MVNDFADAECPGDEAAVWEGTAGARATVALFAGEHDWLTLDVLHPPHPAPVVSTESWPAFACIMPAACGVVLLPPVLPSARGDTGRRYDDVRALRCEHPWVPLGLVSDCALLPDVAALGEVIRPPLDRVRLWPAVHRACARALLEEAAAEFEAAAPSRLREALAASCRADVPVPTVTALARLVGCNRHTLWRHWQESNQAVASLDLEDVVEWIVLLRAYVRRRERTTWTQVAACLGVHRQTLRRIAERLAHLPLRDLSPDAEPRVRSLFRRNVLNLLRTSDPVVPRRP